MKRINQGTLPRPKKKSCNTQSYGGPEILKGEIKLDRANLKSNKRAGPEYFVTDKITEFMNEIYDCGNIL